MLKTILKNIGKFNFKTIYFNLKYLPLKQAIYFPIFVSRKCSLLKRKGQVTILGRLSPGLIQIGFGSIGVFDKRYSRSILDIGGELTFAGKCRIGHGSKISIGKNGRLFLGNNFSISAESTIICHENIKFGKNVLISWDVLIMDTDLHRIETKDSFQINRNKPIKFGDKVWIGCRSLILKGAKIPNGTIVAAGTTISSTKTEKEATIIGDFPNRILAEAVTWHL